MASSINSVWNFFRAGLTLAAGRRADDHAEIPANERVFEVPVNVSIDSVKLNSAELTKVEKSETRFVLRTQEGDLVEIGFCPDPTPCPYRLDQLKELEAMSAQSFERSGNTQVSFAVKEYGGVTCLESVLEARQKPYGVRCTGSLVVPRKRFTYFINIYAPERGTTGLRDAIIFDRVCDEIGWDAAKEQAGSLEWEGYKEKYDEEFPNHPLSRVRKFLKLLAASIEFDDAIVQSEPFSPTVTD